MQTIQDIALVLVSAGFMGMLISFFYRYSHSRAVYASQMTYALIMYTILSSMLLYMRISFSAASVIGAAAIVRFRNPIKDHRDLTYILWAVIAGFCCATHMYEVLGVGSVLIVIVISLFKAIKQLDRVLIAVKGEGTKEEEIIAGISKLAGDNKLRMLENNSVTDSSTELIYEVHEKENAFAFAEKLKEMIYVSMPEVNAVTVVYQEDDMSI